MRKSLLTSSILLITVCVAQNRHPQPETLADFDLKGPVKEFTCTTTCDEPSEDGMILYRGVTSNDGCYKKAVFNQYGYLTNYIVYFNSSTRADSLVIEFDASKRLISYAEIGLPFQSCDIYLYEYIDTNDLLRAVTLKRNGYGSEVCRYVRDSATQSLHTFYEHYNWSGELTYSKHILEQFDLDGNVISRQEIGRKNKPISIITYTYNPKGLLTHEQRWRLLAKKENPYPNNFSFDNRYLKYDSDGNLLSESFFRDTSEKAFYVKTFTYDGSNNQVLESGSFSGSTWGSYRVETAYDSLSRKTLVTHFSGDNMQEFTMYTYDENGNLMLEIKEEPAVKVYPPSGENKSGWVETKHTEYEYDSYGNWIKMTYLDWDRSVQTTTRTITYYE